MNKKILYVEISTAHTEILHSFVEALVPDFDVQLLINEKSLKRVQHLSTKIKITPLNEQNYLKEILYYKTQLRPDVILLNSAQGRRIRDLCLRLIFDKTPVFGIHHNAENIYKSFTQKIIHLKVKKYIVLADFIRDFVRTKLGPSKIKVESFYPLTYPDVAKIQIDTSFNYILIPGVLEQDRRDYVGFVEMVKAVDGELHPKLKFVLLGNSKNHDGPAVSDLIRRLQLQSRFVLFETYVEDEILLAYAEKCVAIMPLMHPGTKWFDKYFETKISGAYSLAFAYDKPLLMHEVFRGKEEFQNHGIFYTAATLAQSIERASTKETIVKQKKFDPKIQKKNLLNFIKN